MSGRRQASAWKICTAHVVRAYPHIADWFSRRILRRRYWGKACVLLFDGYIARLHVEL
jgi:hypothetical protein